MPFSALCSDRPRGSKVRGAPIPSEYKLLGFIANISDPHPSWSDHNKAFRWHGVYCTSGDITTVNWAGMQKQGTLGWQHIPQTLLSLTLNNNAFYGTVDWGFLPPKLSVLDLASNRFSGSVDCDLLPKTLEYLYLPRNLFSGEVDFVALFRERSLMCFDLSGNAGLRGEIAVHSIPSTLRYWFTTETEIKRV